MAWNGLYYRRLSPFMVTSKFTKRIRLSNGSLIGGTLAVQGSVFDWCAGHRLHHRHVDDIYQDPLLCQAWLLVLTYRVDAQKLPKRPL